MAIDTAKAKTTLKQLRSEIEQLIADSTDARSVVELDQVAVGRLSRMDAMQQQAMAQAADRSRQRDLVRIEQAERRLRDGDYGYCEDCGEEIAEKRLAIDPMAERCVRCAS